MKKAKSYFLMGLITIGFLLNSRVYSNTLYDQYKGN